ncbi:MAG: shikimate dehydrogenase, partial [Longimicrobiales bacterium]
GNPVAHSLSPTFQSAAFTAAGCDGIYVALKCDHSDVKSLIRALAHAGGGGNVTIPHKEKAAEAIDVPSDAVLRTGACNTFWLENGRVHGDNTDVEGVRAALRHVDAKVTGGCALVLGAGGAASAVLCALMDAGITRIDLRNRSFDRAEALRRRVDPERNVVRLVAESDDITDRRYDIILNATSLGRADSDALPLDLSIVQAPGAVIDVVYRTGGTAFVKDALARGIPAVDGREMLLAQGAAAFELWWKQPAPLDVMRATLGL